MNRTIFYHNEMSSTALLVIDFINDIVDPRGKIAHAAERIIENQVIEHANQVIEYARKKKWQLIFVKVGFHQGYPECPKASPIFGNVPSNKALLLGNWGTEFHKNLAIKASDLIIVKHRINCFYATPLEAILRAQKRDALVLTGVATHMAIEHAVRHAHDLDYSVTVIQDACEAGSEKLHNDAIESIKNYAKVVTTKELLHQDVS